MVATQADTEDETVTVELSVAHIKGEWVIGTPQPIDAYSDEVERVLVDMIDEYEEELEAEVDHPDILQRVGDVHGDGGEVTITTGGEIVNIDLVDWDDALSRVTLTDDYHKSVYVEQNDFGAATVSLLDY